VVHSGASAGTDAAVAIDVVAETLFEAFEQFLQQLPILAKFLLKPVNATLKRTRPAVLRTDLALLDEIPK
jgi:hypothetical protein